MQLVVDTNILVRCCRGRASRDVLALAASGIRLVTTEHNATELLDVLVKRFAMTVAAASDAADFALRPFDLLLESSYRHRRGEAGARLRQGGQPDWPALAAALALDCGIWSEDVDFFGTGVAVWSTANVRRLPSPPQEPISHG